MSGRSPHLDSTTTVPCTSLCPVNTARSLNVDTAPRLDTRPERWNAPVFTNVTPVRKYKSFRSCPAALKLASINLKSKGCGRLPRPSIRTPLPLSTKVKW